MSTLSAQLKKLANGINPETGEILEDGSVANRPDVIRVLFALAEELADSDLPSKKPKLTPEERRKKNIAEGRPGKSNFPWTDEDRALLASEYEMNHAIEHLAQIFERSSIAIAIQLENLGLISSEEADSYRPKRTRP